MQSSDIPVQITWPIDSKFKIGILTLDKLRSAEQKTEIRNSRKKRSSGTFFFARVLTSQSFTCLYTVTKLRISTNKRNQKRRIAEPRTSNDLLTSKVNEAPRWHEGFDSAILVFFHVTIRLISLRGKFCVTPRVIIWPSPCVPSPLPVCWLLDVDGVGDDVRI